MKSFGVDIALRRADDLDKLILSEISCSDTPRVLDIGSGSLGQSFRIAEKGAEVTAIDVESQAHCLKENLHTVKFILGDAIDVVSHLSTDSYDFALAQRMVHYLPYSTTLELLKELHRVLNKKLYISVTGTESDIGRFYADKNISIEERFCKLLPSEQETFSITEPICLYSKEEFSAVLERAGWSVDKIWTSSFGNHKAICSKSEV